MRRSSNVNGLRIPNVEVVESAGRGSSSIVNSFIDAHLRPSRLSRGAFEVIMLSSSPVKILPDEVALCTDEVLRALNEDPVLVLHLGQTNSTSIRQHYKEISKALDRKKFGELAQYVIAVSYSELVRIATTVGGMHAATVQSVYDRVMLRDCEAYWNDYAKHNYQRPIAGQTRVVRQFNLRAAFMPTEEFAKIHTK